LKESYRLSKVNEKEKPKDPYDVMRTILTPKQPEKEVKQGAKKQ